MSGLSRKAAQLAALPLFAASTLLQAEPAVPSNPALSKRISDSELLAYARSPFDKYAKINGRETLGLHRGFPVVVDFACSDVCPEYLTRIVHYDVPADLEKCNRVGGVIRKEWVPVLMASLPLPFCEPKILADAGIAASR